MDNQSNPSTRLENSWESYRQKYRNLQTSGGIQKGLTPYIQSPEQLEQDYEVALVEVGILPYDEPKPEEATHWYIPSEGMPWSTPKFEVSTTYIPPTTVVPMEGMPWNIPGGVHSPSHTTSEEFLTRDALYRMTQEPS